MYRLLSAARTLKRLQRPFSNRVLASIGVPGRSPPPSIKEFQVELLELRSPAGALIQLDRLVGGRREGEQLGYYETGQLLYRRRFLENRVHGLQEIFYPSGALNASLNFNRGRAEGVQMYWHEDGAPLQEETISYSNGVPEVRVRGWYPLRGLKTEERFVNYEKEGLQREWYPLPVQDWREGGPLNGPLRMEESYRGGELHGVQNQYAPDGTVLSQRLFSSVKLQAALKV